MPVRLFVGNVAHEATEADVRELFSKAGRPTFVRLPTDRETGSPRGFAFVEFGERAEADEAIRTLDRQLFKGRPLSVSEARPRSPIGQSRPVEAPYPGPPAADFGGEGKPPRRNFGPDAPPRGKRKPERRVDGRDGASKSRSRPAPSRPGFEEQEGPDDFDLWKTADAEGDD
jgi:RNA recognition motif-containing protein